MSPDNGPYAALPEPQRTAARRSHAAIHALWSKAVGTPGYNKSEWKELAESIDEIIRMACP